VWLKARSTAPARSGELFGARAAAVGYHPITGMDAAPTTEQLGAVGPWHLRLPHFKLEFTPSNGAELQSEYFVPRKDGPAALQALHAVQDRFAGHLMVGELRTIAADELWLSSAYRQDCLAFHFTWHPDWPAVQQVLPVIEAALRPFGVRPHWGKLFTMPKAEIATRWSRLGDFRALAGRYDPTGKFRNDFLAATVF
jgi:xylitol oxidase